MEMYGQSLTTLMIDRRVKRGANREDSEQLLSDLIDQHEGWNLVTALVYNDFATERQAMKFVGKD